MPTERKHLWRKGEHAFRSLILDRRGRVVSAGFPKFFNSDEGQARAERRRLAEQIRAGAKAAPTGS